VKKNVKSVCESKSFELIFNEFFSTIRNYIYYKGCDSDQAEDIAQEAFITLWNNCKKVEYNRALFYLKRIANNKFLNVVKHNKVVLNYSKQKTSNSNIETPQFLIEEKEFKQKLQNAINSLTDKEKEVFLLNRIDKKTYSQIAEFLEISIKAVEKRMHNALKKIKDKIKYSNNI